MTSPGKVVMIRLKGLDLIVLKHGGSVVLTSMYIQMLALKFYEGFWLII